MSKSKPIFSLESLYKICYDLKKYGKRIGLTHGAFDLFHHAHLDLLQKSASMCDFLIVGVDSDISIQHYKGCKRPIVKEEHRMEIISELNCVDAAFVKNIPHDSISHTELYKNLLVDQIIIGTRFADRYKREIYEEANSVGTRLIEIKVEDDPSTTAMINQIVDKYSEEYLPVEKTN
ncbi:MAG: adenylyltransferase/cytidyltransferase family protein [Candidatus Dojkabacteria bacterium]|nr:adenylyltransferase/cytidyltransferase family protein [Candidatus Dojkabacteria bacterium]